jgi:AcrR family transcriptional regulator
MTTSNTLCPVRVKLYAAPVPKLWETTIEAHRREVRDAILETTWALVNERGLLAVTMSQIAEATGIGRATLYKYFPDVEAILETWHQEHVAAHLAQLADLRHRSGDPRKRLEAVLHAYARICYSRQRHGTEELAALLHRGEQIAPAQQQLLDFFRDLLEDVAATGALRTDVPPDELAKYCIHALAAAGGFPSEAATRRLAGVTLDGLRPLPAARRPPRVHRRARH